jgi:hypothetical protein
MWLASHPHHRNLPGVHRPKEEKSGLTEFADSFWSALWSAQAMLVHQRIC